MFGNISNAQKFFTVVYDFGMEGGFMADLAIRSGARLICHAGRGNVYQFADDSCVIIKGDHIETTTLYPLRFARLNKLKIA